MARLHLIKGIFRGSLGDFVGSPTKNKKSVRVKMFMPMVRNARQKQNATNFRKLNSFCVQFAKLYGYDFPHLTTLKAKKDYFMSTWKGLLKDGVFPSQGFVSCIPFFLHRQNISCTFNTNTRAVSFRVTDYSPTIPFENPLMYVLVFDDLGTLLASNRTSPYPQDLFFTIPETLSQNLYVSGFLYCRHKRKVRFFSPFFYSFTLQRGFYD